MNFKTLATAACLSLATASASFAVPINVTFLFSDPEALFDGYPFANTVTGVIEGLDSDGLGQQATRITAKGWVQDYVFTSFQFNTFDVSAGVIDTGSVRVVASSTSQIGYPVELDWSGAKPRFSLYETEGFIFLGAPVFTDASAITFASDYSLATVPLPAGGLLLLSGMVGIAGLKRRKKRAT